MHGFAGLTGFARPTKVITQDLLRELFEYNSETGQVFRKTTNAKGGGKKGDSVGSLTESGYLRTSISGKRHQVHRLIWCWVTGEWPKEGMIVDHINGDRSDNRWENLRLCTASQNAYNRKTPRRNKSGFTGVYKDARNGKFLVKAGGEHLGSFDTINEAVAARVRFERGIFE